MAISHFCHKVFLKSSAADASEIFLMWERVNKVVTPDGSLVDGKKERKEQEEGSTLTQTTDQLL